MTDICKKKIIIILVKRAGRHFGFFKRAGRHEKGAGRRALQKKPRQNTVSSEEGVSGLYIRWQSVAVSYGRVLLLSGHGMREELLSCRKMS